MVPCWLGSRPSKVRNSVVLPAPLPPSTASVSPAATPNVTPSPTRREPKPYARSRTSSIGVDVIGGLIDRALVFTDGSCDDDGDEAVVCCTRLEHRTRASEQCDENRRADDRRDNAGRHLDRCYRARERVDREHEGRTEQCRGRQQARETGADDEPR